MVVVKSYQAFLAEFLGTFALVFVGTGAIVINEEMNGIISHFGIAICFGLIVTCMIYTFSKFSGAHFNPAVTFTFLILKEIKLKKAIHYVLFQLLGALLASYFLKFLFPSNTFLGATLPSGTEMQSFVLEIILTFILILTLLLVVTNSENTKNYAGFIIGAVVLLEALFAGPICGASMNPIRSLSPAIASFHFESIWIYLTAPFIGALTAIGCYKIFKKN